MIFLAYKRSFSCYFCDTFCCICGHFTLFFNIFAPINLFLMDVNSIRMENTLPANISDILSKFYPNAFSMHMENLVHLLETRFPYAWNTFFCLSWTLYAHPSKILSSLQNKYPSLRLKIEVIANSMCMENAGPAN